MQHRHLDLPAGRATSNARHDNLRLSLADRRGAARAGARRALRSSGARRWSSWSPSRSRSSRRRVLLRCSGRASTRWSLAGLGGRGRAWSSTRRSSSPSRSRSGCASAARRAAARRRAAVVRDAAVDVRAPLVYATLIALLAVVPVAVLGGPARGVLRAAGARLRAGAVAAAMLVAVTVDPGADSRCCLGAGDAQRSARLPLRSPQQRYEPRTRRPLSGGRARSALAWPRGLVLAVAVAALPLLGTSLSRSSRTATSSSVSRGRARHVEPADDRDRHAARPRSCARCPGSRTSARTSAARSPATRSSTSAPAMCGSASTADAEYDEHDGRDPGDRRGTARCRARRRTYTEQKIRDVGALTSGENTVGGERPRCPDRLGPAARRCACSGRTRTSWSAGAAGQGADGRGAGVDDPRVDSAPRAAHARDRGRPRQGPGRRRHAGRRPPRRGHAAPGHPGRQRLPRSRRCSTSSSRAPRPRGESLDDVRNLLIDRPDGGHVRLGDVADVRVAQTPPSSSATPCRAGSTSRRACPDAAWPRSAADIETRLAATTSRWSTTPRCGSESTAEEIGAARVDRLRRRRGGRGVPAPAGRVPQLAACRRCPSPPCPWRWSAGVLPRSSSGAVLSLGALVGLLAVLGLATRTAVLLVGQARAAGAPTARRSARTHVVARARPSGSGRGHHRGRAGAAHVAARGPRAPSRVWRSLHPMAIVVLGGLVTSTLVTPVPAAGALPAPRQRSQGADPHRPGDPPSARGRAVSPEAWPASGNPVDCGRRAATDGR